MGTNTGAGTFGSARTGRLKRESGLAQKSEDSTGGPDTPDVADGQDDLESDGRRLRRSRNREAVVDALLALYSEGNLDPSAADVAERSGLSPRSLFRYFTDVDDLARAAIARQYAILMPIAVIALDLDAPLEERARSLADRRVNVFEIAGKVGLVARLRAPFEPVIAGQLTEIRTQLRAQIKDLFSGELKELGTTRGPAVLAAIDSLCSFEAYHLWRGDQGLGMPEITALLTDSILALLGRPPT
ncbi:MAG TPA: TetR/AcrR family transcriptional regulator [Acidimicrobiales bacterium]|jgi:TetR/AcrR family transcriptional regulator of autoinduction and epiphytic fitness|nr:TetR/AcrR family transcriptional regulator [Acidimicrobiales bacterium]